MHDACLPSSGTTVRCCTIRASPKSPPRTEFTQVVLVDFWTYTCINWLRTLAFVRALSEKYRDQGLVVINVHTPEFPFERDVDNVRKAAQAMRVEYPIALDSDYGVWNAFGNRYWPAVYLADAEGRIRYHHFGEGEYDDGEWMIQHLLREAGGEGIDNELVSVADATEVNPRLRWEAWATASTGLLEDVKAIGVGGQQDGVVALDGAGDVVRPALLLNDTRSAADAVDLVAERGSMFGRRQWGRHRPPEVFAGKMRARIRRGLIDVLLH